MNFKTLNETLKEYTDKKLIVKPYNVDNYDSLLSYYEGYILLDSILFNSNMYNSKNKIIKLAQEHFKDVPNNIEVEY